MSIFKTSVPAPERKPLRLWRKVKVHSPFPGPAPVEFEMQRVLETEVHFLQVLSRERKRAERSGQHFLLMLLEGAEALGHGGQGISAVAAALARSIRETDLCGWYRQDEVIGVIFTEVNGAEVVSVVEALNAKVQAALRGRLEPEEVERIQIFFHLFPEPPNGDGWRASEDSEWRALINDGRYLVGLPKSRYPVTALSK